MVLKAILFDWDGTLVDSHEVIVACCSQVLAEEGFEADPQVIVESIGSGRFILFKRYFQRKEILVDESTINRLVERSVAVQVPLMAGVRFLPGALDLIRTLRDVKVKTAVASAVREETIFSALSARGIDDLFDIVIGENEIEKKKPEPDVFLRAAEKLDVKRSECVVIEDSFVGVTAAHRAGMVCVAVTTGQHSRGELAGLKPELIVDDLRGLDYQRLQKLCDHD